MELLVVKTYLLTLATGISNKPFHKTDFNYTKKIRINTTQQIGNRGFTLLELMVVIVIVGIMFSFLALSIRGTSPEEAIKTESCAKVALFV